MSQTWRRGLLALAWLVSLCPLASGQEPPRSNGAGDGATVLHSHTEVEVLEEGDAWLRVRRAVEIRSEAAGRKHGFWSAWEGSLRRCTSFKARILDGTGRVVRTCKRSDLTQSSFEQDPAAHSDSWTLWADLRWGNHPYVVEVEAEFRVHSLLLITDWFPQEEIPVREASFSLFHPGTPPFHVLPVGRAEEADAQTDSTATHLGWRLVDLPALPEEMDVPAECRLRHGLWLAPRQFTLGGVTGSFDSWAAFGDWYRRLSQGRDTLSPEACAEVRGWVAGVESPRERVATLYRRLAERTRYVNIQLGPGGWQPRPAQQVHDSGYGDCKALSTYMIAMLKAIDMPAWPVLVRNRDLGAWPTGFPSAPFNHMICFVPLVGDTLWLECTSDVMAAGALPTQDQSLAVLVLGDSLTRVLETPLAPAEANQSVGRVRARLDPGGALDVDLSWQLTGAPAAALRSHLHGLDDETLPRWTREWMEGRFPGFTLGQGLAVKHQREVERPLELEVGGSCSHWLQPMGPLCRLAPFRLHRVARGGIPAAAARQCDVELDQACWEVDSVSVELPPGMEVEALPDPLELNRPFGTYRATYGREGRILTARREFRLATTRVPAQDVPDYRDFLLAVARQDEAGFILKP